jgi:hypothetical protein
MRLLAFCPAPDAEPTQARVGRSHCAILECFLPVLRGIGETIVVHDPVEAATRIESTTEDRALLVCVGPPHGAASVPSSRGVTLFDWAADAVLDPAQEESWRRVLAAHGCALALSPQAAAAVRHVMSDSFPVHEIGVPVFDRWRSAERSRPPQGRRTIAVTGSVLDSRDYQISAEGFRRSTPIKRYCTRTWSGGREELRFDVESDATAYLGGFYEPETWGTWSRIAHPWIMLPFALSGNVKLTFRMAAYGRNVGRPVGIEIGGVLRDLVVWDRFDEQCVPFPLEWPDHVIQFHGLDTDQIPDAPDHRSMGIGLRSIAVEGAAPIAPAEPPAPVREQTVGGVVYTSLDADLEDLHQSAWRDVIKAFCFTFRKTSDATLVLHVRHPLPPFVARLQSLLHRIGPVRCRIVALHGELSDPQLRQLIDASTYYVHAPRCERLSLPLMQFTSAGVPALVASHTSGTSGVTDDAAFVFGSVLEGPAWPGPERKEFFVGYHYPQWSSLVSAFAASHRVAKRQRALYARMSRAARDLQAASSSDAAIGAELEDLLRRQTTRGASF